MSSDTAPIRPDERFDEERVADHLRRNLPDLLGGSSIVFEQFPGGKANLTYLARAGDVELVLRRPPLGEVAPRSHDMAREYRVLSVLHSAFPQAPEALHFCGDPEVMGKPFFVMERRRGEVIREEWPPSVDGTEAGRRTVAGNLIDTLADLHLVDHVALGLGDLGRPEGFTTRQVEGWTERWIRAQHHEVPAMDALGERLLSRVPAPQRAVLLHNDFKLDNTMIGSGGDVVAVFDWDMATLGDPLVDLGTALSYWGGTGSKTRMVTSDATAPGVVMPAEEAARRYAVRTGLDLGELDWYRALGSFRIAVILQQIHIRWVRGQTRDERFAVLGDLVGPLAEGALESLD